MRHEVADHGRVGIAGPSHGVETPCRPSKSWKVAATIMSEPAVAITAGSVVNTDTRDTGTAANTSPRRP